MTLVAAHLTITINAGQNANVGMLPPSDSEEESEEEEVLGATKSKQVSVTCSGLKQQLSCYRQDFRHLLEGYLSLEQSIGLIYSDTAINVVLFSHLSRLAW